MKNILGFLFLLLLIISCQQNKISYNQLFIPTPPNIDFDKNSEYQFYKGDTIKSQHKISNDSIFVKFTYFDKKQGINKESIMKMYYVIPKIYSNIEADGNNLPYEVSFNPLSNKGFYNYIRNYKNSEFVAYVINNKKIIFKDYIKDFKEGNNLHMSNKEQLLDFLKSNKIQYKILKDIYIKESGRQYLMLKIISHKDSSINKVTLSKFDFQMKTYYEADTIPDWNKVTYDRFRY